MQARGLLMIEHRLIERMLSVVKDVVSEINTKGSVDPVFVDTVVDFIKIYADRTHHGKEEDILFQELKAKSLSAEDQLAMDELIKDHVFGRQTTRALVDANKRYRDGDNSALSDIADKLQTLVKFYPKHIEKEDKVFFPNSKVYFTDQEERNMIGEFLEFDQKMIHEKYKATVEEIENNRP